MTKNMFKQNHGFSWLSRSTSPSQMPRNILRKLDTRDSASPFSKVALMRWRKTRSMKKPQTHWVVRVTNWVMARSSHCTPLHPKKPRYVPSSTTEKIRRKGVLVSGDKNRICSAKRPHVPKPCFIAKWKALSDRMELTIVIHCNVCMQ